MMYVMAFAIRVSNYEFVVGGTNLDILGFCILSYSHDVHGLLIAFSYITIWIISYRYKQLQISITKLFEK